MRHIPYTGLFVIKRRVIGDHIIHYSVAMDREYLRYAMPCTMIVRISKQFPASIGLELKLIAQYIQYNPITKQLVIIINAFIVYTEW